MPAAARIPVSDIARIARVVNAYEARGDGGNAAANALPRNTADLRGVLLEALVADLSTGDTRPVDMVVLEAVGDPCFVLRVPVSDARPFRLRFEGFTTSDLTRNTTAEELQSALEAHPPFAGAVAVVGKGSRVGEANRPWNPPIWFLRVTTDSTATFSVADQPENHADATITQTRDWPTDQVESAYARFAGDEFVAAGAIVACRVSTGVGYRVWSARLNRPTPCPATNTQVRVALFGPPTAGTWALPIHIPLDDPDTEQLEIETFVVEDLQWNCTAEDLQTAIDAIPELEGKVIVTLGPAHQSMFNLEFIDTLGHQLIPLPSVNWGGLEGVILGGHSYYAIPGRAGEVAT